MPLGPSAMNAHPCVYANPLEREVHRKHAIWRHASANILRRSIRCTAASDTEGFRHSWHVRRTGMPMADAYLHSTHSLQWKIVVSCILQHVSCDGTTYSLSLRGQQRHRLRIPFSDSKSHSEKRDRQAGQQKTCTDRREAICVHLDHPPCISLPALLALPAV